MSVPFTIDDIVHQFADPYSFVRELVQNSIDAGSMEVDVRVEREGEDMVVHVRDWGEGMSREIIETKLVRLFASDKLDDLTKIGRFGIGFASVFAVAPSEVCVDTGQAGASWRVVFRPDFTWDLYALREPVEGTHVRVRKPASEDEVKQVAQDVEHRLRASCRHVAIPVSFHGEDVREPFEIHSLCQIERVEEGSRLLMGIVAGGGREEFYNRGLALVDRPSSRPWLTYKLDSRLLEHTLTRDALLQDRHFHDATVWVEDTVGDLLVELRRRLEASAARGEPPGELFRAVPLLPAELAAHRWKIVPSARGPVTLTDCRRAFEKGRLWLAAPDVDDADDDHIVLAGRAWDPHNEVIHDYCMVNTAGGPEATFYDEWRVLSRPNARSSSTVIAELLRAAGSSVESVEFVSIRDRRGSASRRGFAAVVRPQHDRVRSTELQAADADTLWSAVPIVFNLQDTGVAEILQAEAAQPLFTAYALVRYAAALHGTLSEEREMALLAEIVRRRGGTWEAA